MDPAEKEAAIMKTIADVDLMEKKDALS